MHRKLANHNTVHFRSFLPKTKDSILHKSPKSPFWPIFGPFFPFFGKMRIFPKNPVPSLLCPYGPGTSCKKSEKSYESILSKYKKKDFAQLLRPLLLLFAPFWGKQAFFQKSDIIILTALWYYIFMQKIIKNS